MKKLESLTEQQIDLMPAIVKKWTDWALTPTTTDSETIRKNIVRLYKMANLEKPENIIVCISLKDFLASVRASVRTSVGDSVRASVGDSVRASVGDSVRASVWDSVRASVGASVWASVWDSVGASVWDSVGVSVWASVRTSVRTSVGDSVGAYYWADDLAFANYFEEIGVLTDAKLIERKAIYIDILKDLSLGFFTEKITIVLTKPHVYRNDNGQLSNDQGLAVKWNSTDGFYFLDGVRFEQDLWRKVVKKQLSFAEIMQIPNADRQAVALKYNPEAIIKENAELLDKSTRGNELFKIENQPINDLLSEPEIYFLRMPCPTGRVFVEGVAPDVARKSLQSFQPADYCQAFALGLDLEQYNHLRMEG